MCDKFYRKCSGCGKDVHTNNVCSNGCGDPWNIYNKMEMELRLLRKICLDISTKIEEFRESRWKF